MLYLVLRRGDIIILQQQIRLFFLVWCWFDVIKLSPSIHKFDDELIQTSAERLDMSSSTCLSRGPQDLVLSEQHF